LALTFGLGESVDQLGKRGAVDLTARLYHGDAEPGCKMAFPCARWSKEVNDLGAPDKVELDEGCDAFAVQRRLEAEVEALERLDRQELRGAQGDVDPAGLSRRAFLAQQRIDRFDGGDLAFFRAAERYDPAPPSRGASSARSVRPGFCPEVRS
jgi:hypothetical protein